ncbi:MAG: cellulase family glycosylhydrolase [Fibromonadales bacterium]|nr:cellulase family glycosylhydrolase [Fibromonadales bacterium]
MLQLAKMLVLLLGFASFSFAGTGPVSYYGELQVNGNKIVGSKTGTETPVQVRGVSLGWSNTTYESSAFYNQVTVNAMIDDWKAEIIRVSYGENNSANETRIKTVIDAAIAKDVYVIIDWHSHNAESQGTNPAVFFGKMARDYGSMDNVIFEIYNEPLAVSWATIRDYAIPVIDTIRKYSDNLILVGTPNWAQNIDAVTSNPISGKGSIAYVLHFYAYSHPLSGNTASGGGNTSRKFEAAANMTLNANLPIFVSEYGTTHADGGDPKKNNYNTHSAINTDAWHTYMDANKISSCAWSVNDKYEGSAFFGTNSGTTSSANRFQQTPENFRDETKMTESGKYIFNKLNHYATTAPWLNPPQPSSSSETPSSSSVAEEPSSSSNDDGTPIITLPKTALLNSVAASKNGINLAVKSNAVVEVFGLKGNSMRKFSFANGVYSVSFSDLPKGLYIVKVSFGSEKMILRVPVN